MGDGRVTVTARVRVTLDIEVRGTWGGDCALGQVEEQATVEAIGACRRGLIVDLQGHGDAKGLRAALVGTPAVEAILTRRDR